MRCIFFFFISVVGSAFAQEPLRQQIQAIAADAHGKVSVACSLPGSSLNGDLNPKGHPPMQSVFKLPLALTILHQVEQGKLSLDQVIRFRSEDRFIPRAYSPLQDEFPNGNVNISLQKLLQMTVSLSDNVAADILLHQAGGPRVVNDYMKSLGVGGFHLVDGEHALHRDVALQYRNWFEPVGAVQLLLRISDNSPLTPKDTELLLGWMRLSPTTHRLQGDLPPGTRVAHKTGTSGMDHGIAAATNDIGLISLPNGKQLAVAVFVTDSTADEATRDKVIARIGRAAYAAATRVAPCR